MGRCRGWKGAYLEAREAEDDVVAPVLLADQRGDAVPGCARCIGAEEVVVLHGHPQTPLVAQRRARGHQRVDVRLARFLQALLASLLDPEFPQEGFVPLLPVLEGCGRPGRSERSAHQYRLVEECALGRGGGEQVRADGHAPCALAEDGYPAAIASEALHEPLDPSQRIPLVLQRQIRVSRLRRVQVAQRAEAVLDARADDGRAIRHGLGHHERGAVLLVDAPEDETAAVDVHQNGEFFCAGRFEGVEGHVELEDQALEFV